MSYEDSSLGCPNSPGDGTSTERFISSGGVDSISKPKCGAWQFDETLCDRPNEYTGCFDGGWNWDDDCDSSSPKPSPSPSSSPSTPPGPQCLSITMNNPEVELGGQTTFTCGAVTGADHYIFRIMSPDGIISSLGATGQVSAPYSISQFGTYFAQCQICTGSSESTCQTWEPLPNPVQ